VPGNQLHGSSALRVTTSLYFYDTQCTTFTLQKLELITQDLGCKKTDDHGTAQSGFFRIAMTKSSPQLQS